MTRHLPIDGIEGFERMELVRYFSNLQENMDGFLDHLRVMNGLDKDKMLWGALVCHLEVATLLACELAKHRDCRPALEPFCREARVAAIRTFLTYEQGIEIFGEGPMKGEVL